jgi:hypothetical protein
VGKGGLQGVNKTAAYRQAAQVKDERRAMRDFFEDGSPIGLGIGDAVVDEGIAEIFFDRRAQANREKDKENEKEE